MSLHALAGRLASLRARDTGATATEYAILVGFIAVVIVVGVTAFGVSLNAWFTALASNLP
jgi:pilus assembly protein Flp/PilA